MHIRNSRFRIMPRTQRVLWLASWSQAGGLLAGRLCGTSFEGTRRPPSTVDPKFECKHWHTRCRGRKRPHSYRFWKLYSLTAKADQSHNWNALSLWLTVGNLASGQVWKGPSPCRWLGLILKMSIRFRFNIQFLPLGLCQMPYKALLGCIVCLQLNSVWQGFWTQQK